MYLSYYFAFALVSLIGMALGVAVFKRRVSLALALLLTWSASVVSLAALPWLPIGVPRDVLHMALFPLFAGTFMTLGIAAGFSLLRRG